MKKILVVILSVTTHSVCAQWSPVTTGLPAIEQVGGISFIHPDSGFIVTGSAGSGGDILKTVNGGTSWTTTPNPFPSTDINYHDVIMLNKDLAYVVGFDYSNMNSGAVILKTTNGGTSWSIQSASGYPALLSVYFLNKDTGFAVGYNGIILRTLNGGTNWNTISSGGTLDLRDIKFPTNNTGYIVGLGGATLKSTDMGATWNPVTSTSGNIECQFTSVNTGFSCRGEDIHKTIDGGASWTSTNIPNTSFQTIEFIDADTGYASGGYGKIYKTINGGSSWHLQQTVGTFGIQAMYSLDFPTAQVGYLGGVNGSLYKTSNGGGPFDNVDEITLTENSVSVFPNPANHFIQISTQRVAHTIRLVDITGSILLEMNPETNNTSLDLTTTKSGMYFICIVLEDTEQTIKIVKE